MKKSLILVGMLAVGHANAQEENGILQYEFYSSSAKKVGGN